MPHAGWIAQIDDLIGAQDKAWPVDIALSEPALAGKAHLAAPGRAPATVQAPKPRRGPVVAVLAALALAVGLWWALPSGPPPVSHTVSLPVGPTVGPDTRVAAKPSAASAPPVATNTDTLFAALALLARQPAQQVQASPERNAYRVGQPIKITLTSPVSGHLAVLFADALQAWPQARSGLQTRVQAGQKLSFPQGIELLAQPPHGAMRWVAVVTTQPVNWADPMMTAANLPHLLAGAAASLPGSITILPADPSR